MTSEVIDAARMVCDGAGMNEIVNEPWRLYPALVVAAIGIGLVVGGMRSGPGAWRAHHGPERAFVYLYTFRRVVVGLALIAAALGWAAQIGWLLGASVTIGIGEWLESSYYLLVMNRLGPGRSAPPAPALRTGP